MISRLSASGSDHSCLPRPGSPKDMQPRQMTETSMPVGPNLVKRIWLEPFYEGGDLAADQLDRLDVAVQKVLGHHPRAARLVQGVQLLNRLLDGAGDPGFLGHLGEVGLAVAALALPLGEARGPV